MKRIHLLVAIAGLVLALPLVATGAKRPDHINLRNGWQPEGIAVGKGNTFYVGSIPTGRVWRGNLRNGQGSVLVPERGRQAVGVAVDERNRLFVAGGRPVTATSTTHGPAPTSRSSTSPTTARS
jgi:hypothetical protein